VSVSKTILSDDDGQLDVEGEREKVAGTSSAVAGGVVDRQEDGFTPMLSPT
jgi:hypothetical protein